jgi:hypothetical protein
MNVRDTRSLLLAVLALGLMSVPALAQTTYTCNLSSASEVPTNASAATGSATVILDASQTQLSVSCSFQNLVGTYTASHIHGPAAVGVNASVKWGFVGAAAGWVFTNSNHDGTLTNFAVTGLTPTDVANLNNGLMYVNVHSVTFPGGEIRGQLTQAPTPTVRTTWGRIKALYR